MGARFAPPAASALPNAAQDTTGLLCWLMLNLLSIKVCLLAYEKSGY